MEPGAWTRWRTLSSLLVIVAILVCESDGVRGEGAAWAEYGGGRSGGSKLGQ